MRRMRARLNALSLGLQGNLAGLRWSWELFAEILRDDPKRFDGHLGMAGAGNSGAVRDKHHCHTLYG